MRFAFVRVSFLACSAVLVAACSPTVRLEVPDKPIVINLNVKIEHEIRVKVDKDLDHVIAEQQDIF